MRAERHLNGSTKSQTTAQPDKAPFSVPSRRGLLTGLVSLIAAPAIVGASSLMPISAPRISRVAVVDTISINPIDWDAAYWKVQKHFRALTWELMTSGREEVITAESEALGRAFDDYPFGLNPPPAALSPRSARHG